MGSGEATATAGAGGNEGRELGKLDKKNPRRGYRLVWGPEGRDASKVRI